MLEHNFSLLLLGLTITLIVSIKGLPVVEPVEPEPEVTAGIPDFGRVLYDQRQEGKYNIHVSIKDVAIIDMDQNKVENDIYDDDEYYYEDVDFTSKPLKPHPATNKPTVSNTLPSLIYTTSQMFNVESENNINTNTASNNDALFTTSLNTEEYPTPTLTTLTKDAETTHLSLKKQVLNNSQNQRKSPLLQQKVESKSKTNYGSHEKELLMQIARQTPESPIYRFEVPQPKPNNKLQQTLAQFKEKQQHDQQQQQQQQHQQEQSFLKAFEKPIKFQTKQLLIPIKQQPLQQNVRYPTPMHQLIYNSHHQHQRQSLHSNCHANQYRDFNGNCQTRRASSSTSATAILRKFFNMLFTLPLRDREQEQK